MNYKMISADDHLDLQYLPTNLWTERLPKALCDRAPHIEDRDGNSMWVCDGEAWGRWAGTGGTAPGGYGPGWRGGASHVRACGRHGDHRSSPAHRPSRPTTTG